MGVMFVYDVQTKFSLQNLSWYMKMLNSLVTQLNGDPIPAVLVGNKVIQNSTVCHARTQTQVCRCALTDFYPMHTV